MAAKKKTKKVVDRVRLYREARAILAVATLHTGKDSPSYYSIALNLGLSKEAENLADEIYYDANGTDEWSLKCEESALEHAFTLIGIEEDS